MIIGIISDTHCVNPSSCTVPEWVCEAFDKADMIIHAGDVERPEMLTALSEIAPVYAVRGNCDTFDYDMPQTRSVEIGGGLLTVAHRADMARNALLPESRVMVYGHTHISVINQEPDLLVINPGSPVLPRGGLPASVAVLKISGNKLHAELITKP